MMRTHRTREATLVVVLLTMLAACGARTDLALVAGDAAAEASDVDGGPRCGGATCATGQVCIHGYYTHDPPPPLPDGGTCTFGIERYRRCWSTTDRCDAVPKECSAAQGCTCPPFTTQSYGGCECQGDGSFNCYVVGI